MVKKLLGDAVREERLRRNLSQNSLAEQAKISLRTVSDIENYIGNPQLETLYALATYLHISIDAIFSNQKTNPDSTMQQIMAELNSLSQTSQKALRPRKFTRTTAYMQHSVPQRNLSSALKHTHIRQSLAYVMALSHR